MREACLILDVFFLYSEKHVEGLEYRIVVTSCRCHRGEKQDFKTKKLTKKNQIYTYKNIKNKKKSSASARVYCTVPSPGF